MGRPITTTSEKTGVYLPEDLKRRAAIAALRRGCTLSQLVADALRAFLAKRQGTLPLDEGQG